LVLVTRPQPEAEATAVQVEALGYRTLIEPLIEIVPCAGPPLEFEGIQAVLVTSANGARALATRTPVRGQRVFAVGDATANTLQQLGFHQVESAGGNADDLARLVQRRCEPSRGTLLHVRGDAVASDPSVPLSGAGFSVRSAVLYETRTPSAFSPSLERTMRHNDLAYGLFFSARTARTFVRLAVAAGVACACERSEALCMSHAVASAAEGVPWQAVRVAVRPDHEALLNLLPKPHCRAEFRSADDE
jgi:uroporphyrinogen-III synthase